MEFDFLPWLYNIFASIPGGEHVWTVLAFIVVLSILVFLQGLGIALFTCAWVLESLINILLSD